MSNDRAKPNTVLELNQADLKVEQMLENLNHIISLSDIELLPEVFSEISQFIEHTDLPEGYAEKLNEALMQYFVMFRSAHGCEYEKFQTAKDIAQTALELQTPNVYPPICMAAGVCAEGIARHFKNDTETYQHWMQTAHGCYEQLLGIKFLATDLQMMQSLPAALARTKGFDGNN